MDNAEIDSLYEAHSAEFIEQWIKFLRFQSISTEPEHHQDCLDCADWLKAELVSMGFSAQLVVTAGKPLVFAERISANADATTVLLYGHYDVQPVDPVDEWSSPPFEPEIRDGRMCARGAQDNKGQLMYVLSAIRVLIEKGVELPGLKVLLEGEEECGSASTGTAIRNMSEQLQADVLMVCDTATVPSGAPTIIMGLRGMLHLTVELTGASKDLHSGVHGGRAPNPAQGIAELVDTLHNDDGSVSVAGFYDGVRPPSERERELANAGGVTPEEYELEIGVPPAAGEKAYSHMERAGFRPTLEVNGIHSGYGGAGTKTVIPSRAVAKLSARLVPGQEPGKCLELIVAHLENHCPDGLSLRITESGVAGGALALDPGSALADKARAVLGRLFGREPVLLWEGASIPILVELAEVSGADPLLVGFGAEEDNVHAPNESFALDRFRRGFSYVAAMLTSLN